MLPIPVYSRERLASASNGSKCASQAGRSDSSLSAYEKRKVSRVPFPPWLAARCSCRSWATPECKFSRIACAVSTLFFSNKHTIARKLVLPAAFPIYTKFVNGSVSGIVVDQATGRRCKGEAKPSVAGANEEQRLAAAERPPLAAAGA